MAATTTLLTAACVCPMAAAGTPPLRDAGGTPPLRDAALAFAAGRIIAIGPARQLRREHPDAVVHDAGNAVILPGLVNAHVHLELSDATPAQPPPAGFADWLLTMVRRGGARTGEQVLAAVAIGIRQCLRFGVTSVGDISRAAGLTRPVLARSPLNVVSYGEVAAMAQRRGQLQPLLAAGADASAASANLHVGISPHAPYSIEPHGYRRCLETARQQALPLATHLAESPDEPQFLANHIGPLRQLWTLLNGWDEQVPRFVGGPIRYAQSLGLLSYPTLLAHVNYCDDDELAILAAGKASVVYCPRTHAYFGHPPHRWRDMLAAGINVAVGTDSCASSPDLNLVDDLRLMHRAAPQVPAEALWRLATCNAAAAIGQAESAGALEPGKRADMVVFDAGADDPLLQVLEGVGAPREIWIGGSRVMDL
jgi:cytosine/adenosine deaminase-related metal-dependent hydrolase